MYKQIKIERDENVLFCDFCLKEIKKERIGYEDFVEVERELRTPKQTHYHLHTKCLAKLISESIS